jgi:hypothetical protein
LEKGAKNKAPLISKPPCAQTSQTDGLILNLRSESAVANEEQCDVIVRERGCEKETRELGISVNHFTYLSLVHQLSNIIFYSLVLLEEALELSLGYVLYIGETWKRDFQSSTPDDSTSD